MEPEDPLDEDDDDEADFLRLLDEPAALLLLPPPLFLSLIFFVSFNSFSSSAYKLCCSLSSLDDEPEDDPLEFARGRRCVRLKSPSKTGFVEGPASNISFVLSSGFFASIVLLGLYR